MFITATVGLTIFNLWSNYIDREQAMTGQVLIILIAQSVEAYTTKYNVQHYYASVRMRKRGIYGTRERRKCGERGEP